MSGFSHPAFDALRTKVELTFDAVDEDVSVNLSEVYTDQDISLKASAAVVVWSETMPEELDESETLIDRLIAMLIGIADADKDGEISDDEADLLDMAANAAADFMLSKGASPEDVDAIFNSDDVDAAERVQELVGSSLPSSYDEIDDEINQFAFGEDAAGDVFDAAYKNVVTYRNGKKTVKKKRVSGIVRQSAAQKLAVQKMLRKSHSAGAQRKRAKSLKARKAAGK